MIVFKCLRQKFLFQFKKTGNQKLDGTLICLTICLYITFEFSRITYQIGHNVLHMVILCNWSIILQSENVVPNFVFA